MRIKLTYGTMKDAFSGAEFWLRGKRVEKTCGKPVFGEAGHTYYAISNPIGQTDSHGPYDEIRVPTGFVFKDGIPSWLDGEVPQPVAKAFAVGVRVRITKPEDLRESLAWTPTMNKFDGAILALSSKAAHSKEWHAREGEGWRFHEDWMEIVD